VIVPEGSSASEFAGAARVYWSLKYVGHDEVAILDGGWNAWVADANNPVETGLTTPVPASFSADLRRELLATTSDVSAVLGTEAVLIDARPPEQYLGQSKSKSVARAGHIPGALNIDNALFYDADANRIKPTAELESFLPAALSSKDVNLVSYCNGGHLGATNWFVLHEVLGYENAALYAASMAGWTEDPANPVEQ
jgi:thiosulfate/3-mercaptopyruvate sulfurtransferase